MAGPVLALEVFALAAASLVPLSPSRPSPLHLCRAIRDRVGRREKHDIFILCKNALFLRKVESPTKVVKYST